MSLRSVAVFLLDAVEKISGYRNRRTGFVNRLFLATLVLHVVVAVLGLGSITSIAIIAATARRNQRTAEALSWLGPLLRVSIISLVALLLSGGLLDFVMHGAFQRSWWFRGSALLLVATGALHGLARRAVRLGLGQESVGEAALRRVEGVAYGMGALIVAITVLMVIKPF